MYWNECKTVDDLWEAARWQHMVMCITRSLSCSTEECKTCGWHPFDEEGWKPCIEREAKKLSEVNHA